MEALFFHIFIKTSSTISLAASFDFTIANANWVSFFAYKLKSCLKES
jgi:hypothetical protein